MPFNEANFVEAPGGDHPLTYRTIINGAVVFEGNQSDAEHAYNVFRPGSAPAGGQPAVTLDCSQGQGAPVNGGCWCCQNGTWDTNPMYCSDATWRARCGNDGGGRAPQPGAPVQPASPPSIPYQPGATLLPTPASPPAPAALPQGALLAAGAILLLVALH